MISDLIFSAIVFAWPFWITNIAFTFVRGMRSSMPFFRRHDAPIDGGALWRGKRIFGDSRSWLSVLLAVIIGIVLSIAGSNLVFLVKSLLTQFGTLIGSFIKRRLGIHSGDRLFLVDQADYMILACCIWIFMYPEKWLVFLTALVMTVIAQPLISYIGYQLRIKERPY